MKSHLFNPTGEKTSGVGETASVRHLPLPGHHSTRHSRVFRRTGSLALVLSAVLLTGCPGGAEDPFDVGNDDQQSSGSSYKVAGTLSLAQNSAIDSDTNDPNQVDRKSNNQFSTAQQLGSPTLLVGYLNVRGEGPEGPSRADGDLVDGFKASLQKGQVVEVQFAADPSTIDVDLFIYNQDRQIVGRSIGLNSYECVQIGADGDYTIAPSLYTTNGASRGGTVYQLRIAAPGSASGCENVTGATAGIVSGEVIAQRVDAITLASQRADKSRLPMPEPVAIKGDIRQARSALLQVPRDLPGVLVSQGLSKAASPAQAVTRLGGDVPESTLRELETIAYAKMLNRSGEYVYAFPNFRLFPLQVQPFPPNDRDYAKQRWHYESIDLPGAINQLANQNPQPTYVPIVAVIDSGIVAEHPDLTNQLVPGYDFIQSTQVAGDGNGIDANPDDADNSTTNAFHGTHVAGTVAAQTYNNTGGAGVAPMAKIMPLRALGNGGGTFYDIEQAVRFAGGLSNDSGTTPARKADVINMSLGATAACTTEINRVYDTVRQAGVIIVAASGNESRDSSLTAVGVPANCPDVIAIGATNPRKTRSYYSNGGAALMAVAPGGDQRQSTQGTGLPDGVYSTVASADGRSRTPSYAMLQGTSMASPHAAGIFALMRFIAPDITHAQVVEAITTGAIIDDLGPAGRDNEYGYGQLNARKAVEHARQVAGAPEPTVGQVSALPTSLNLSSADDSAKFELRVSGESTERVTGVTVSNNKIVVSEDPGGVDAQTGLGTYVVTVDPANANSNTATFADVIVTLEPAREIRIPVSLANNTVGGSGGDLGPIYVVVMDVTDGQRKPVAETLVAAPTGGVYRYEVTVPGTSKIVVVAGSDTDNDGAICNKGEACGAYPFLGNNQTEILEPRGNLSGIDFSLAPFGGINPTSSGVSAGSKSQQAAPGGKHRVTVSALGRQGIVRLDK